MEGRLSRISSERVMKLNLPPGYDYSLTRKRRLSNLQRLLLLAGFIAAFLFVGISGPMGLLMFAVFVMPVLIGVYLVFHFVTEWRRKQAPLTQRRMRISPKMRRPAQTRNHWTVANSQYEDPELYEQAPGQPRIS
jgi:hypothetical protein